jgi:hypothetical protein
MPNFSSGTPIAKRIATKLPKEIPHPSGSQWGAPKSSIRPADKAYITVLPEVSKRSYSSGSLVNKKHIKWTVPKIDSAAIQLSEFPDRV